MPDIRYVCLSDMHLGADSSVLTHMKPDSVDIDPTKPGPILLQLVACLRELIAQNESPTKPTLILNGDILELALAETNVAAMVFERFIELIFPKDGEALFDRNILYIPGNHDHHIWENARETQYVNFMSGIPTGSYLEVPWHTTKMFAPDLIRGYFLTNLLQRYPHLKDAVVSIIYPNYALTSSDGQKCVVFSHGHYVESLYSLMSTFDTMVFPERPKPSVVWDLEAENFAWIDFFWSTMGRSGAAGQDIGLIYNKLQDQQQVEQLINTTVKSFVEKQKHAKWAEGLEEKGLNRLLETILMRTSILEKHKPASVLSTDAEHGLHWYLEGPLLEQIRIENHQHIPVDITFIFGHTHKPFSQKMPFAGYPAEISVYNSGGWVVDTVQPGPIYGAAVILLDEALQTTALRMYNQAASTDEYMVSVEEATHAKATSNTFYERIYKMVNPKSGPWKTFSETIAEAINLHDQILWKKIHQ